MSVLSVVPSTFVSPSLQTPGNTDVLVPPSFAALFSSSPSLPPSGLVNLHLHTLHGYLASFTYNTTPGPEHMPHIQSIKSQPLRHITHTAQQIIHRRLPIRCLEAVVVALHLLAATEAEVAERCGGVRLLRYPLRFYSTCGGHHYWHILLVVALMPPLSPSPSSSDAALPVFGAVSLSRHAPLSLRELKFDSLSALCSSLREEYRRIGHSILQMTVGLPVTQDERSRATLDWHFLALHLSVSNQHSYNHDTATTPLADQQLPTTPPADEADEPIAGDGAEEMVTTAAEYTPAAMPVYNLAVAREWCRVCDVLDRYALRATQYATQMTHNRQRPAQARPLTPLHPHCHFDSRTQQLKYESSAANHRVRTLSGTASNSENVQKEAGGGAAGREERSGSVTAPERVVVLPRPPRRHTLPTRRAADRSAFAV